MSKPQFGDWFCLKNRPMFTIDPKVNIGDAQLYFGRNELRDRIRKQVSRAFIDPQVPKMMVYGAYGSGKTQTLYHVAHDLMTKPPSSVGFAIGFTANTIDEAPRILVRPDITSRIGKHNSEQIHCRELASADDRISRNDNVLWRNFCYDG